MPQSLNESMATDTTNPPNASRCLRVIESLARLPCTFEDPHQFRDYLINFDVSLKICLIQPTPISNLPGQREQTLSLVGTEIDRFIEEYSHLMSTNVKESMISNKICLVKEGLYLRNELQMLNYLEDEPAKTDYATWGYLGCSKRFCLPCAFVINYGSNV